MGAHFKAGCEHHCSQGAKNDDEYEEFGSRGVADKSVANDGIACGPSDNTQELKALSNNVSEVESYDKGAGHPSRDIAM